ncbi:hypothetical protein J3E71DRAFT_187083 [Bipolaris maydis]|nr:hypothetical protein J3E71DRAFT_187083 [Bipolaris maydis]
MATRSSADEAISKLMSDEQKSIMSSAKMHIRILQAQLLFLRETSSVPREIEGLLSELMIAFPDRPTVVTQPQAKLTTPTHNILNPPLAISVRDAYLCGNYRHVVANAGDRVIVFAWTNNRTEAIAYNPRNKTAGRISVDLLDEGESEPFIDTTLCMTTSSESHSSFGHVVWKAGDYIRVWNREDKSHAVSEGFCFNLATGAIGRFHTTCFSPRIIT